MASPPWCEGTPPDAAGRGLDAEDEKPPKRQKLEDSAGRTWGEDPRGGGFQMPAFDRGEVIAACKGEQEVVLETESFTGDPLFDELAAVLGLKQEAGEPSGASEAESAPLYCDGSKHPSANPALVELGTLRLPFKVCRGLTFEQISKQTIQYADPYWINTDKQMLDRYGDQITVWHLPGRLELLPIPCPPQCRIGLPADVAVRVTLMDFDGLGPARSYGVRVAPRTTATEVACALQQQHSIELGAKESLLLYDLHSHRMVPNGSDELKLDVVHNKDYPGVGPGFIAYRVPLGQKQAFVAVRHENTNVKKDPTALELEDSYFGTPLLLPVDESVLHGGKQARDDILKAIHIALSSYHYCGSVAAMENVAMVFKGHANPHLIPKTITRDIEVSIFDNRQLKASSVTCPVGYVTVQWDPMVLGASFDLDHFNSPVLDSSVATVDVKALRAVCDECERMKSIESHLKDLPSEALKDLQHAGLATVKKTETSTHKEPPYVFMDLKWEQDEERADHGTALIKIYAWRHTHARTLFAKTTGLKKNRFKITNALEAMLLNNTTAAPMYRGLWDWRDRWQKWLYSTVRPGSPITGLLEQLEAGPGPEICQPEGLAVQLLPYQRQSLKFLIDCERQRMGYHGWFWVPLADSNGTVSWYSPVFELLVHELPAHQTGGFLAEEMGLGKTVEVLALVLSNPHIKIEESPSTSPSEPLRSRATLVICPVSLVGQWHDEVQEKMARKLEVYMYHGHRLKQPQRLAKDFDIVITTYETLASDYDANCQALLSIHWHRLILDEGHNVKDSTTTKAKACQALIATHRWVCTGTPINTDATDLSGQFQALHLYPLDKPSFFTSAVKTAYSNAGNGRTFRSTADMSTLSYVLSKCMVRHTKRQTFGGQNILQLPSKKEEFVEVAFTPKEAEAYKKVYHEAARQFGQLKSWNRNIMSDYFRIMSLLLPLRRMCSGGTLTSGELTITPLFGQSTTSTGSGATPTGSVVAPDGAECPICLDTAERPTRTPCQHWFCHECIFHMVESLAPQWPGCAPLPPRCPLCRQPFTKDQLLEGKRHNEDLLEVSDSQEASGSGSDGTSQQVFTFNSKLDAVISELKDMLATCPTAKCLIFSQYSSTLNALTTPLANAGFSYRTITGSMTMKKRKEAIAAFQKDPPTTVFLLSMRSGCMGINLTAASHVFLLEPALNPALQEQAIGRAWRMGQQRQVTVKKFFVKGSVEENIINVVKQKGTVGVQQETSKTSKHLRTHATAGSMRTDRNEMRLAEFETLFTNPAF